jgi:hypothetical protein
MTFWTLEKLQQLIDDGIKESLILEYKAAGALGRSDGKKREITKDISAIANSAGGVLIYGVSEFQQKEKAHLPEKLDPIDSSEYSKEWLEQVISNISPKIEGLIIEPVTIGDDSDRAYVVDVPKSTTAHQATDWRYYKRHNFLSIPMDDHEIRDVMNRSIMPNIEVEFTFDLVVIGMENHEYLLKIRVVNVGVKAIHNYKLEFIFPNYAPELISSTTYTATKHPYFGLITKGKNENDDYIHSFRSKNLLFPQDDFDIGELINLQYSINHKADISIRALNRGRGTDVEWILFADDMEPKKGKVSFSELHKY